MSENRPDYPQCHKTGIRSHSHEHVRHRTSGKSVCENCGKQYARLRDHHCPDQQSECNNCGSRYTRLRDHRCPDQQSECNNCGRRYTRLRDHRCPDQKSECKNCGGRYAKLRNHHCRSLFSYLSLNDHGWASKCPERFTYGLASLENIDDKTRSLWGNRVPSLLPLTSPHSDLSLWTAVFTSIVEKPTYHAYQDGDAPSIELSDPPPAHGKTATRAEDKRRQGLLRRRKIEIAATAMLQTTATVIQPPICSVLNVWLSPLSGISMKPPEQLESSHHVCESEFETGINITPEGCFVDLHHDLGREGLSRTFGKCEKVWLLFPPTEENLRLYISSAGFTNRLARIGSELHGGIITKTTSAYALDLPAGTLHAVFTTVGGFLGGINYSTTESLPTMSRLLIAHLRIFRQVSNTVLEDLQMYTNALSSTLDMDAPELVPYALRSWVDLYPHLQNSLESEHASTELIRHVSKAQKELGTFARNTHYALQCACGYFARNIGEHFAASHVLAVGSRDLRSASTDTSARMQGHKRKREIDE